MNGIGKRFIKETKYQHMDQPDQLKGIEPPEIEMEYDLAKRLIKLPDPKSFEVEGINIRELFERRRSVRRYSKIPLSLEELSYLLWCTQGVKKVIRNSVTFRTVPSAGARHAFETYILANNVEGLQRGLYRFIATQHKLLEVNLEQDITDRIVAGCLGQAFVAESAATFIWLADTYRMTWRYGERGYRYLHLDAGHVCQNLYLAAESINCGACAIAAFSDDDMNEILEADGEKRFVIYIGAVGKK